MSDNVLLISDTILKERTAIHGNIDPKLIYPDIKVAQDMYIHPILGTALFLKMQKIVGDGTITSDSNNSNYKRLWEAYIIDTLMYYTLAELPTTLGYQIWNKGVVRKQGENTELPSMSELVDISNRHRHRAEYYANRLKLYIISNANKMFPEYLNPGTTIDTVIPETKSFSMPVFLGEGRSPFENPGGFNGQPYQD